MVGNEHTHTHTISLLTNSTTTSEKNNRIHMPHTFKCASNHRHHPWWKIAAARGDGGNMIALALLVCTHTRAHVSLCRWKQCQRPTRIKLARMCVCLFGTYSLASQLSGLGDARRGTADYWLCNLRPLDWASLYSVAVGTLVLCTHTHTIWVEMRFNRRANLMCSRCLRCVYNASM